MHVISSWAITINAGGIYNKDFKQINSILTSSIVQRLVVNSEKKEKSVIMRSVSPEQKEPEEKTKDKLASKDEAESGESERPKWGEGDAALLADMPLEETASKMDGNAFYSSFTLVVSNLNHLLPSL